MTSTNSGDVMGWLPTGLEWPDTSMNGEGGRDDTCEGAVRPIRTRLCKDNMTALYAAPRPRHSARATARLSLKFVRVERLRS